MSETELHELRGSQISMIFQDPMTALNPVKTVLDQIAEGYKQHHGCTKGEANKRAVEMLKMVGIGADRAQEYPHQFSGGKMCIRDSAYAMVKCVLSFSASSERDTSAS